MTINGKNSTEQYQNAQRLLYNQHASVFMRLEAHELICRLDSYGGAGSMVLAKNQSAALADIAAALIELNKIVSKVR